MIKYYRLTSSFDANGGKTHVDGRVHFELASSPEEAKQKVVDDLKRWGYSNMEITDCHEETEEEKYGKKLYEQVLEIEVQEAVQESTRLSSVSEKMKNLEDVDELF